MTTTGVGAGSPCRIALASSSISCGVKPARAATVGSTFITIAEPLIVFSIPFFTSSTVSIFLIRSPTFGAHVFSRSGSGENSLISIGSGELVRSPIMSCNIWMNSTSSCGYSSFTLSRTSEIT